MNNIVVIGISVYLIYKYYQHRVLTWSMSGRTHLFKEATRVMFIYHVGGFFVVNPFFYH